MTDRDITLPPLPPSMAEFWPRRELYCGNDMVAYARAAVLADRAAAPAEQMTASEAADLIEAAFERAAPAEPVAWMLGLGGVTRVRRVAEEAGSLGRDVTPLYAHPLRDEAWIAEAMRLADEYAYYAVEAYWRNNDEYRKVRDEDRAALEAHLRGKEC